LLFRSVLPIIVLISFIGFRKLLLMLLVVGVVDVVKVSNDKNVVNIESGVYRSLQYRFPSIAVHSSENIMLNCNEWPCSGLLTLGRVLEAFASIQQGDC